jgi:molybdopterin/thiamine biosynthesis adenylyltransferase
VLTDDQRRRLSRQIALTQIGEEGQQLIGRGSALVIGLGGLGAPAALYLANAGIGHLVLNDFDRVDASNLPRQILFRPGDVGEFKTHAAGAQLAQSSPDLHVAVLNRRLDDAELADAVAACGVVLDCTDNFATRVRINAACAAAGKPLVSGAAIRFEGQLAVFRHDQAGGPCYSCLYSDADETLENCAGQGILGPVAGTVGCMMATETLKILAGLPSDLAGKLWVYDALAGNSRSLRINPRSDCPVCAQRR